MADDLRAQVEEVRHELQRLKLVRRRTALLSTTGLLLAVYGFGTRNPAIIASGLGGFVSSLAAAHNVMTQLELREHGLMHKPAYVLLTAADTVRERAAHRH